MTSTIQPEKILSELSELWVTLGKPAEGEASSGVLRACSMTLIVLCEEADDASAIGETLAALNPEHPSRAIVIRVQASAERNLSARVLAQCWMPFGYRRQICCEQIEISASDSSLPDLPAVVLPLAVPDLPVILWCRSPRLFRHPDFPRLGGIAQKTVLDSSGFADARAILTELAAMVRAGRPLGDLSWTRLTRWRELIAQIFENRVYLARLPQVSEARVTYAGPAVPATAWYMGSWLQEGLAKAGGRAQLRFEAVEGAAASELQRVALRGDNLEVSIGLVEGRAAEIHVDGLVNRTVFPAPSDYALMREELFFPTRDLLYERTLAAAAALALSFTQG